MYVHNYVYVCVFVVCLGRNNLARNNIQQQSTDGAAITLVLLCLDCNYYIYAIAIS